MKVEFSPTDNLAISKAAIVEVVKILSCNELTELNFALEKLFEESCREIDQLVSGLENLVLASMHTRNIFELYLIIRHVSKDGEALKEWYGQMYKDLADINDGFEKLLDREGVESSRLKESRKIIDSDLADSPYEACRGFNIYELAQEYGYLEDYSFVYKLCSKIIHPTSMKVNGYSSLVESETYQKLVVRIGVYFSNKVEIFANNFKAELGGGG